MKAYKYIPLLLTVFLGGCYVMDVPEAATPNPEVLLSLDDDPFSATEPIVLGYEQSATLAFTYVDISRVTATAPLGWSAVVKMTGGNGTIKVSAPKYGTESVPSGDLVLKLYDGSGSYTEKVIKVSAFEDTLEFDITGFDLNTTSEFTLGSRTTINYSCSPSFKNLEFTLPAGWKSQEKVRGSFVIIAPDLTIEEGDESGTVTVTPVSWGGTKDASLARSFAVHVDRNKPTFQFVEDEVNFVFGETKEVEIVAKGVKDLVYPVVPDGWTIDWSGLDDGSIKVTAPAADASPMTGSSALVVSATSNADNTTITTNTSVIRLYGINDADDLLAFRAVYEAEDPDDPNTDPEAIGKWMVDGKLSINADFTLTTPMLTKSAYIIKTLKVGLEGNNHTLTLDLACNASIAAIFQYTEADVSNLKLAGTLSNSYETGVSYIGSLVANPMTCTIENVESSVDITFNVGPDVLVKTNVGGIASNPRTNFSPTFKNCKYSGKMVLNNDIFGCGGIVSATDLGKPGATTTCDGCTFSGEIILNHQKSDSGITPRVGGIIGDLGRIGVVTNCVSTGSITVNAGGKRVLSSSAGGFGGVVGRNTAPSDGYTMACTIKNCSFSGTIKVVGTASGEDRTRYGQIIGCVPNAKAQEALVQDSNTSGGTVSFE